MSPWSSILERRPDSFRLASFFAHGSGKNFERLLRRERRMTRHGCLNVGILRLAFAGLVSVPASHAIVAAPAQTQPFASEAALLIGINEYRYLPDLEGTSNDLALFRNVLVGSLGFAERNIDVVTNADASREGILNAFGRLLKKAGPTTAVVIYYSGHGSRLVDDDEFEESDGLDESIVPFESGRAPYENRDITDDTINEYLAALHAVTPNILVVIDSCHSGTVTRGPRSRSVPIDRRPPPQHPRPWWAVERVASASGPDGRGVAPAAAKYVALVASASEERAYEHSYNGETFGAFTWHLANELRRAAEDEKASTYRDIMEVVRSKVRSDVPYQNPNISGSNIDNLVLSIERRPVDAHYALAEPVDPRTARIAVGAVHGATIGSHYEIYPPKTRQFVAGRGRVAIISTVGTANALAYLSEAGEPILVGSRAVQRIHRLEARPTTIRLVGRSGFLNRVHRRLTSLSAQGRGWVTVVAHEAADLTLSESRGWIRLERSSFGGRDGGLTAAPAVNIAQSGAFERVLKNVEHWAKWYVVRRLGRAKADSAIPAASSRREVVLRVDVPPGRALKPQQAYHVSMINTAKRRAVYVHLISLSSDGAIDVVFPKNEVNEALAPNHRVRKTLRAELPEATDGIVYTVMLVATAKPVDFGALVQPGLRTGDPRKAMEGEPAGRLDGPSLGPYPSWTVQAVDIVVQRQ